MHLLRERIAAGDLYEMPTFAPCVRMCCQRTAPDLTSHREPQREMLGWVDMLRSSRSVEVGSESEDKPRNQRTHAPYVVLGGGV